MNGEYAYDLFVSHTRAQRPWVRAAVEQWRGLDLKVFLDEDDIRPGAQVIRAIEDGLQKSRYVIFVITPEAVKSRWVALEIACAVHDSPDLRDSRVIPILLQPTKPDQISLTIRTLSHVDLTMADPGERTMSYHRLLQHLNVPKARLCAPPPLTDNQSPKESKTETITLPDSEPPGNTPCTIELFINGSLDTFSKEHQEQIFQAIRTLLRVRGVVIKGLRSGSVVLIMEMTREQARIVGAAVRLGKLLRFGITEAAILPDEGTSIREEFRARSYTGIELPGTACEAGDNRAVIAFADDDESDQMFLKFAFKKNDFENPVVQLPDGQHVIDYLKGEGKYADRSKYPLPAILLLDLKMPRVSGFEVLHWLRSHPEYNHLVTVVFSSSRATPDIQRAFALGANSYIVKPSIMEQWQSAIRKMRDYWLNVNSHPWFESQPA